MTMHHTDRWLVLCLLVGSMSVYGQSFELTDTTFSAGCIYVAEGIVFDGHTTVIEPISFQLLDSIAGFLKKNPQLIIEIRSHRGNYPKDQYEKMSLRLTMDRSKAVRDYLCANGIKFDRIIAVGMGYSEPLSVEWQPATKDAREQINQMNERVELKIVRTDMHEESISDDDRDLSDSIPCPDPIDFIVPGVGFSGVIVGQTRVTDVLKLYGTNYTTDTTWFTAWVYWAGRGCDLSEMMGEVIMTYKNEGVAFHRSPYSDIIHSVTVFAPCTLVVSKGSIVLGESTFHDVEKSFGDKEWSFAGRYVVKRYNGIQFQISCRTCKGRKLRSGKAKALEESKVESIKIVKRIE